jgi:hypothetical protein
MLFVQIRISGASREEEEEEEEEKEKRRKRRRRRRRRRMASSGELLHEKSPMRLRSVFLGFHLFSGGSVGF